MSGTQDRCTRVRSGARVVHEHEWCTRVRSGARDYGAVHVCGVMHENEWCTRTCGARVEVVHE